jgi:hypothetical protein
MSPEHVSGAGPAFGARSVLRAGLRSERRESPPERERARALVRARGASRTGHEDAAAGRARPFRHGNDRQARSRYAGAGVDGARVHRRGRARAGLVHVPRFAPRHRGFTRSLPGDDRRAPVDGRSAAADGEHRRRLGAFVGTPAPCGSDSQGLAGDSIVARGPAVESAAREGRLHGPLRVRRAGNEAMEAKVPMTRAPTQPPSAAASVPASTGHTYDVGLGTGASAYPGASQSSW